MAVATRLYDHMLGQHFARHRQMALVRRPRGDFPNRDSTTE